MKAQIVFKKNKNNSNYYLEIDNLVSIIDSSGLEVTDFSKFKFSPNVNYTFVGDEIQLINSSEVTNIKIF